MTDRRQNNVTCLGHKYLGKFPGPLLAGGKGLKCHSHVSKILEECVYATPFSSPDPDGGYLFYTKASLNGFHGCLNANLMQSSLPLDRVRDFLTQDLEPEREVADVRPEKQHEHLLKNPVENQLNRIVIREAAAGEPPVGNHSIATGLQDFIHHPVHGRGFGFQIG